MEFRTGAYIHDDKRNQRRSRLIIDSAFNNLPGKTTDQRCVRSSCTLSTPMPVYKPVMDTMSQSGFQIWIASEILNKTPWPQSASELYRQSDRRLLAMLVPTFEDIGCRVVSETDPYGRIF
jgi:hypothetical protein